MKKTINFTDQEKSDIIESYKNGVSKNQLRLKYNVSEGVIKRLLQNNGVAIRQVQQANKRKYNINDDYFDIESPNMAYIMGFWAADGNVSATENRLDLELQSIDIEILKQINAELKNERPVKTYYCQNGYTKNKVLFWSSKIKKVFGEYGIVPNKTYSTDFHAPYALNKKYWIDYIRGFFDGDGCIKKGNSIAFELNCLNKQFLQDIQSFLQDTYKIESKITWSGSVYRLYTYGKNTKKVFSILYTPNSLYLKRKHDKWIQYYKDIKSHETLPTSDEVEKIC